MTGRYLLCLTFVLTLSASRMGQAAGGPSQPTCEASLVSNGEASVEKPKAGEAKPKKNERPAVVFTFEGNDEMDPCSGRGWAFRKGDRIGGKIVFHGGDESKFKAETTSG